MTSRDVKVPSDLKFDAAGLIPCIVQDSDTGRVIMFAWMNAESIKISIETGETHFWSRSRAEIWHKGATSGNTQTLISLGFDCDMDALLARVKPSGPACHNGLESCFDSGRLELGPA